MRQTDRGISSHITWGGCHFSLNPLAWERPIESYSSVGNFLISYFGDADDKRFKILGLSPTIVINGDCTSCFALKQIKLLIFQESEIAYS